SDRQTPHHVAQNVNTDTFPRKDEGVTGRPSSIVIRKASSGGNRHMLDQWRAPQYASSPPISSGPATSTRPTMRSSFTTRPLFGGVPHPGSTRPTPRPPSPRSP